MKTFSFESIGTRWQIDILENISRTKLEEIRVNVQSFLEEFTVTYSRFSAESTVTRISEKIGRYKFPESARELFSIYKKLYDLSDGRFTPLIGDTLSLAGYDRKYSLVSKKMTRPKKWEEVMQFSYPYLSTHEKVILDFGACGKGYAIDRISHLLKEAKIKSYIIDASGDLYISEAKNTRIGLENPLDPKQVIGVATINNVSICASSLNRRKWDKYSHIIDPRTLASPEGILGVWVISKKAVLADALATALFLDRPDKFKKDFKFEYLILYSDFSISKSMKFPAEIYYNN